MDQAAISASCEFIQFYVEIGRQAQKKRKILK